MVHSFLVLAALPLCKPALDGFQTFGRAELLTIATVIEG
jgi:hypothetical protein